MNSANDTAPRYTVDATDNALGEFGAATAARIRAELMGLYGEQAGFMLVVIAPRKEGDTVQALNLFSNMHDESVVTYARQIAGVKPGDFYMGAHDWLRAVAGAQGEVT